MSEIIAETQIELAGMEIRVGITKYTTSRGYEIKKPFASKVKTDNIQILRSRINQLEQENNKLKEQIKGFIGSLQNGNLER